jgi:hypothetical protein
MGSPFALSAALICWAVATPTPCRPANFMMIAASFFASGVAAGGVHYAGSRKRCQTVDKVSDARGLPETVGCVDARGWNKAAGKQPERANQT